MEPILYTPIKRDTPKLMTKMPSAWGDIPTIILDIIERFNLERGSCLEFGVEFGYSTSALANYFERVVGVDTFIGDPHAGVREDHFKMTSENLSEYPNIRLIQTTYQEYIRDNAEIFDMIHVDIIHTYEHTFDCGEWAVKHAKVTLFHDTESFPEVRRACVDLATKHNLVFYNYPLSYGLGILYNPRV